MGEDNGLRLNELQMGLYFRELRDFEPFKAQIELENKLITSCIAKMQSLDLQSEQNIAQAYVRVRAELEVLKRLQKERARITEVKPNSHSSVKGE